MKTFTKLALVTAVIISGIAIADAPTPEPKLATEVLAGYDKTADSTVFEIGANKSQVMDNARKLVWSRCLVGQTFDTTTESCTGNATEFESWDNALKSSKDGWRVANIKELASIIEETQALPAVDNGLFPFANTLNFYGHEDTRGSKKWVSTSKTHPNEECTEYDPWGYSTPKGKTSGEYCRETTLPAKYTVQKSSPYLWSSTPVAPYSDSEAHKESANQAYSLSIADGSLKISNRDGTVTDGYGHNEQRARYVLLVKDL